MNDREFDHMYGEIARQQQAADDEKARRQAQPAEDSRRAQTAANDEFKRHIDYFLYRMKSTGNPGMVRLVPHEIVFKAWETIGDIRGYRATMPLSFRQKRVLRKANRSILESGERGWICSSLSSGSGEDATGVNLAISTSGRIGAGSRTPIELRAADEPLIDCYQVTFHSNVEWPPGVPSIPELTRVLVELLRQNNVV
ncbi:hypothetical protein [Streptomyces mirabilis]|uniref:hypothetical protein n=1 Tax=Streptomyces mirabilis TaxID=68239 RepID=UPI003695D35C